MSATYRIFAILLLSITTASTATSAAESVRTDSDSAYCYTPAETRQIAVLLAEGERCDSLLAIANRQVTVLDSIRIKYAALENNLSDIQRQSATLIADLAAQNKALQSETEKLRRADKCKKRIAAGSLVLNVALILLLVL
jgi:septal ring factor EnvC (AmiA/AmiB activator)